jgi:hypothetical protein
MKQRILKFKADCEEAQRNLNLSRDEILRLRALGKTPSTNCPMHDAKYQLRCCPEECGVPSFFKFIEKGK